MHAWSWPHLDDVIGGADRVFVVLDDDDGVADVAQALERRDHLRVVLRVQADARLVEDVEHAHQAGADLRRQPDALRLAARERAGAAVEVEIVEADAEQELQPRADLAEHLTARVRAAAGRLDRAEECLQLVEVELPDVVNGAAADGEQQPRRPDARALAVGARVLDHHLVEPRLHLRARLAALAVAAIVALDAPGDAAEADFAALVLRRLHLGVGRRRHRDLPRLDAVEDGLADFLGQLLPRRVERETERVRQAEHHPSVPGIRVVLERLAHEAAAEDAALRIGDEQLGMRQLVDAEPAARAAGALRVVEDEELGTDVAIHEVMRRAAESLVEAVDVRLAGAFRAFLDHVHLQQPVADEQRRGDARLDRLLVLASDDEAVDDGVDVADVRIVDGRLLGEIDRLAVDNQPAAAFLAHLGEDEVEILAVDLEHRRAQLDFGAVRQRQDGLEDLARRAARRGLAGSRTMRLADRREQQVQIARDVGHRADGRPRVVGERLLLDRDDRREAEDEVDVGLGNLRHEPLRERRERFHVAPLALGVDGVERQARLA